MTGARYPVAVLAVLAALAVTIALLVVAAQLVRERPREQDITPPTPVSLVAVPDEAPPPEEPDRQPPPPPEREPQVDFAPELPTPSLTAPALSGPAVALDPALFGQTAPTGDLTFEAGELDRHPRAVVRTPPRYPFRARQRRIEGRVRVRFLVSADGNTSDIRILASQPEGVFDDVVREAVASWRFEPGRLGGEAVAAWIVTPIVFDLDGGS